MLTMAFVVLTAAVGLGLLLAAQTARPDAARPSARISITHGALGGAGLVVLLLALRAPARGVAQGAGVFGWDAAGLLGAALVLGLLILARRSASGLVLILHGICAITGYVILTSYISFR